jgi:hypothetical protein
VEKCARHDIIYHRGPVCIPTECLRI